MFIDREKELGELNKLYEDDRFQFVVVYGRRRVGKTFLLLEFCKDKPCIFFTAKETSERDMLEGFSQSVFSFFGLKGLTSFDSWEKAFQFLAGRARNERLVVVLDEFPYMVNSSKSLPSTLQKLIDHELSNTRLFLIVCGSSMSFMEKEILSYKSPLYGRRTGQLLVEPFDFFNARKFFPKYSFDEQVVVYGVLGGIPQYLKAFDQEKDVYENIRSQILSKTSFLYEEPMFLLRQELREPSTYNSIIEAIATGSSTLNQISTKVGMENDKCAKYLSSLIALRIVKKSYPVTERKGRRNSIYTLNDNFFEFWYRFVFPNKELIDMERIDVVLEEKIKPQMSTYLGNTFEQICREFLIRMNGLGKLPFVFERIGKWWGNNPIKKRQEEIDILAYSRDHALFAECKWQNKKAGLETLERLFERSSFFDFKYKYYAIFSKSGFTSELEEMASHAKNIMLYSTEEIEKA